MRDAHREAGDETNSSQPRVTVLMSVYNGEKYLRAAIDSVLNQTFRDFEFLIIDDGSRDRSREIMAEYQDPRIRLLPNAQNIGLIGSLNAGIDAARGELIARQDCDDILEPHRLQTQVAYFDEHSDAVLVGAWLRLIDERDAEITVWRYPETDLEIRWKSMFNAAVAHPAAMFRTKVVRQVGGYGRDFVLAEDYELWSRLGQQGRMYNIPQILQHYRVHTGSVTTRNDVAQSEKRAAIARRIIEANTQGKLSSSTVEVLARSAPVANVRELRTLADAYRSLLDSFAEQQRISKSLRSVLEADIAERLSTSIRDASFWTRLVSLPHVAALFPAGFLSGRRLVSWLVAENVRKVAKRLLGARLQQV